MRVLVIEDYTPLREAVVSYLTDAGIIVDSTADGDEGLWYAQNHHFDVIVLDLMLPGVNGVEILEKLRTAGDNVPIIITSALDSVENRVEGLELGADDYLIKPYSLKELLARVRAHIRRHYNKQSQVINVSGVTIDLGARKVSYDGKPINLSAREYSILEYLAYRQGQVVTREELWSHVYGEDDGGNSNAVDVYIGYLRKKINPKGENLIETHRGQGYSLKSA